MLREATSLLMKVGLIMMALALALVITAQGPGRYLLQIQRKRDIDNRSEGRVGDGAGERDMVTLQTCTPYPTFEKRLIVRADRM